MRCLQIVKESRIFYAVLECDGYYKMGSRQRRMTGVKVLIIGGESSKHKEFPHMVRAF